MAYLLFRWVINAVALLVVANVVPGFGVSTFYTALIAALVLGLVNALIRPLLFILTLPVTILTLGLFTFVLNALMILLVSTIVKGFTVEGFVPALLAALLLWVISLGTNWLIKEAKQLETEHQRCFSKPPYPPHHLSTFPYGSLQLSDSDNARHFCRRIACCSQRGHRPPIPQRL